MDEVRKMGEAAITNADKSLDELGSAAEMAAAHDAKRHAKRAEDIAAMGGITDADVPFDALNDNQEDDQSMAA